MNMHVGTEHKVLNTHIFMVVLIEYLQVVEVTAYAVCYGGGIFSLFSFLCLVSGWLFVFWQEIFKFIFKRYKWSRWIDLFE